MRGGPAEATGRGATTIIPDVVAVVQRYGGVRLRRVGRRYVGLCPLHGDRRPSLSVDPAGNRWYCFGCQQGGGPVQWVMAVLQVDRPTALARLRADGWLGPLTPKARQARREAALERTLQARLEAKCEQATMALLPVRRALWRGLPDLVDPWERADAQARLDRLDDLLDRLAAGEPEARLAALEEASTWASC